jgi:hypothetical protein
MTRALALVILVSCARPATPTTAPTASSSRADKDGEEALLVTPARIFPPTERSDIMAEAFEPDGSRRFVSQGMRLVERPDGSLDSAAEFFPPARAITATALPQRFGGGFLFVANTGGSAMLFGAATWTAPLSPVGRFDGEVDRLVAGFDRIYLLRKPSSAWIAIDPTTGREVGLGSLPPAPGYGAMAFADEWLGAVELPFLGVSATFDAGGTWHRLGIDHALLSAADGGVLVETAGRRQVLGPSGTLEPVEADSGRPGSAKRKVSLSGIRRPLGLRPLETAVLHGFPEPRGTALVAAGGNLLRVRLQDGAVVAETRDAYPGADVCDPVKISASAGFVCGEAAGATRIFAVEEPLSLRLVHSFAEPRKVAPNGRGSLVVRGGCSDGTAHEPVYCVLPGHAEPYLVARGSDTERVVALSDGRTAVIEPPRTGFSGTLTFAGPSTRGPTVRLRFPKPTDEALSVLLGQGFWLDALEQAESGKIRGFIAGASTFVGVRLDLSGELQLGEPEQSLDRAFLSGRYGLVVGRSGGARETTDGGFHWSDADLATEPDLKAERSFGATNGCTAVGCAFAGWLRVGWGSPERVKRAPAPEATSFQSPGGGRWSLECDADGRKSQPALPVRPENDERTVSPWNPFAEVAPPIRAASDTGFDVGSEAELYLYRAYVWGPPGDGWARQARWLVRVRDPYRVDGGVWSTAPSPVPWSRAEQAADVFGRSTSGPPSTFRLLSDPLRHVALLMVTLRGSMDLFLLEEGRAIVRLNTSGALGVVTGFAMAKNRVYVGALSENRSFRVYRVEASGLKLVDELPDVAARPEAPTLAPSLHGDALGLWVHSVHHYLYPFDPNRGALDSPIVVRANDLSRMPEPCNSGEDGYVVGDALSLEPSFDLTGKGGAGFRVGNGAEVRLVVSQSRVCVDGIAAQGGPLGSDGKDPASQTFGMLGSRGPGRGLGSGPGSERLGTRARGGIRLSGPSASGPGRGTEGAKGTPRPSSERTNDSDRASDSAAREKTSPKLSTQSTLRVPFVLNTPDGGRRSFGCFD